MQSESRKSQIANCSGGRDLSAEEREVLEALVSGKTQREAAELVGVSRRTVQYWVKRPAFVAAMEARKAAMWRELRESLSRPRAAVSADQRVKSRRGRRRGESKLDELRRKAAGPVQSVYQRVALLSAVARLEMKAARRRGRGV